jgi:hypothetical protein
MYYILNFCIYKFTTGIQELTFHGFFFFLPPCGTSQYSLVLPGFLGDLQHRRPCCLKIGTITCLPFHSICPLSPFFVLQHWKQLRVEEAVIVFAVPGIKLRALQILGKNSTTELLPQSLVF